MTACVLWGGMPPLFRLHLPPGAMESSGTWSHSKGPELEFGSPASFQSRRSCLRHVVLGCRHGQDLLAGGALACTTQCRRCCFRRTDYKTQREMVIEEVNDGGGDQSLYSYMYINLQILLHPEKAFLFSISTYGPNKRIYMTCTCT